MTCLVVAKEYLNITHRHTLVGDIENLSNALAIKWNRYHGSYSALFSNLRSGFRELSRVSADGRTKNCV